jgi:hypothetical protein
MLENVARQGLLDRGNYITSMKNQSLDRNPLDRNPPRARLWRQPDWSSFGGNPACFVMLCACSHNSPLHSTACDLSSEQQISTMDYTLPTSTLEGLTERMKHLIIRWYPVSLISRVSRIEVYCISRLSFVFKKTTAYTTFHAMLGFLIENMSIHEVDASLPTTGNDSDFGPGWPYVVIGPPRPGAPGLTCCTSCRLGRAARQSANMVINTRPWLALERLRVYAATPANGLQPGHYLRCFLGLERSNGPSVYHNPNWSSSERGIQ